MKPPSPADLMGLELKRWTRETGLFISLHAKERMAEMGVTREQVRLLANEADLSRPGSLTESTGAPGTIHTRDDMPDWAAVTCPADEPGLRVVVSVVFRTDRPYVREGRTWRPADE